MLQAFWGFAGQLFRLRGMIWAMARRDLAARYVGSAGGIFWAVVQPLVTVAVYWFVFSVGFRAQGPGGAPFILYFLGGFVPWLFFSEVVNASVPAVVGNAHLVKKTLFPTQILPVVQVVAASAAHGALLLAYIGLAAATVGASWISLPQLLYYYLALAALALGFGWLLSALQVFSRDVQQGAAVALNLWFWLTPIVWTADLLPPEYRWIVDANPMSYVVQGYRDSVLGGGAIWDRPLAAAGYWLAAGGALALGALVFRRLKPEFADVL